MTSYNINTPIYSTSYELTNDLISDSSNFNSLMNRLIDNENRLILPKDLRDFFISINDSIVFKLIDNDIGKFIGSNLRDYKIIIGNRLNQNIIENLDAESDIIFSKNTNLNLNKISILVNSKDYPSFEVDEKFKINNKNNINLDSNLERIYINNIPFPTKYENNDINNKYLILQDSKLIWKKINKDLDNSDIPENAKFIGNVKLNNFNLEFTDNRKCPINIGDIVKGEEFKKISISDILKKVVYDYLPPNIELSFIEPHTNNSIEVGSNISPKVEYKIYKKSKSVNVSFINLLPSTITPITDIGYKLVNGILDTIITNNILNISYTYSSILNDGVQNVQKNLILNGVYPYFYGFTEQNILSNDFLSSLTKDIKTKSDTNINLSGTGTYYFIYPHSYGELLEILSNNLAISQIYSNFFNSPNDQWNNIRFYVYQFNNVDISESEIASFKI